MRINYEWQEITFFWGVKGAEITHSNQVNMDSANAWVPERGGYLGNKWEKGIS